MDARHYAVDETLRDGRNIRIRAARPDDADRLVAAFRKLDPASVYLRFFAPKKELTEADFRRFRELDFDKRVILLATAIEAGEEIVIASATYVRDDMQRAEIAFIVEEDYQRLGIARRLLTHLGRIATAAGLATFTAEVLPQNTAMLGVFSRCGWPMQTHAADGCVHVSLDLRPSAGRPMPSA